MRISGWIVAALTLVGMGAFAQARAQSDTVQSLYEAAKRAGKSRRRPQTIREVG